MPTIMSRTLATLMDSDNSFLSDFPSEACHFSATMRYTSLFEASFSSGFCPVSSAAYRLVALHALKATDCSIARIMSCRAATPPILERLETCLSRDLDDLQIGVLDELEKRGNGLTERSFCALNNIG